MCKNVKIYALAIRLAIKNRFILKLPNYKKKTKLMHNIILHRHWRARVYLQHKILFNNFTTMRAIILFIFNAIRVCVCISAAHRESFYLYDYANIFAHICRLFGIYAYIVDLNQTFWPMAVHIIKTFTFNSQQLC